MSVCLVKLSILSLSLYFDGVLDECCSYRSRRINQTVTRRRVLNALSACYAKLQNGYCAHVFVPILAKFTRRRVRQIH